MTTTTLTHRIARGLAPLAAAFALVAGVTVGSARPAAAALALPVGSTIHAVLRSQDVNSKNATVGEPLTFTVVGPYPGGHSSLAGSTIYGRVAQVRKAGQGRKAQLGFTFDKIVLPNGESSPISAGVTAIKTTSENTTARKALGAGAGAAVGSQTIGRILGGTLGGVVGTVGGAVGGYAYANNDKANINYANGAPITLQTTREVELRQAR